MAKKKKNLKRNEHLRRERKERRERHLAIREAMRELSDLLQHSEPPTARYDRHVN
jgi:hypothetical protein